MNIKLLYCVILTSVCGFSGCKAKEKESVPVVAIGKFKLLAARFGAYSLELIDASKNVEAPSKSTLTIDFTTAVDSVSAKNSILLLDDSAKSVPVKYGFPDQSRSVSLLPNDSLIPGKKYSVSLSNNLKAINNQSFEGSSFGFTVSKGVLKLDSIKFGNQKSKTGIRVVEMDLKLEIKLWFSVPLKENTLSGNTFVFNSKSGQVPFVYSLSPDKKIITITPNADLKSLTRYTFQINNTLKGAQDQNFAGLSQFFYTRVDVADKFPQIPDEDLLTLVQRQTLKYFYDNAHPTAGLAPERNTSPNTMALGGSGFGIMALIVGVERGFITRVQGLERWNKMVNFLKRADRFHGAWSHWIDGNTAKVIPFSTNDDGGDLVETAFMVHGLITLRQYLNKSNPVENQLVSKIDSLCNAVEWDWFRRGNQNVLYWHWSPRVAWAMNFPLRGYNETLITYVLAASSSTYTIPKEVYTSGFATGGRFLNGQSYYGFPLPLGEPLGGPLFFTHYSFLGLKPTQLRDIYANYRTQNVNHSKINYAYCVSNPKKYVGYSADCWGLTASDNQVGYSAHSPTNDLGVITPTAALSSFPYTPVESMRALKYFYYKLGDRTWGPNGFYDAFNQTEDWYGKSYLAIDQGPIVVMMENYRTGLLWSLFMSAPEVQQGLTKLGFTF